MVGFLQEHQAMSSLIWIWIWFITEQFAKGKIVLESTGLIQLDNFLISLNILFSFSNLKTNNTRHNKVHKIV